MRSAVKCLTFPFSLPHTCSLSIFLGAVSFVTMSLCLSIHSASLAQLQTHRESQMYLVISSFQGLSRWHSGKKSTCQCRRHKRCPFDPWVGKIAWSRKWQHLPISLSGKFNGQRSLVGYSPWDHKELDMTKGTHTHTYIKFAILIIFKYAVKWH